ncbi:MAG: hypothetical protein FWH02_04805 [Oscillospiraceae bacterium]|nr:hypothetical protein [Oscillospiraceae bacterium]
MDKGVHQIAYAKPQFAADPGTCGFAGTPCDGCLYTYDIKFAAVFSGDERTVVLP